MSNLLNVGCGSCFNKEWINIDLASNSPYVRQYDIRKGLPYDDNYFDAVYSSNMLEHLKEDEVEVFLMEAYRVLKKGGKFRLAVPDLGRIVLEYLDSLNKVKKEYSKENEANYDWMMLELLDQTVRTHSGGRMGEFLSQDVILNKDFIKYRIGNEAEAIWNSKGTCIKHKRNPLRTIKRIIIEILKKLKIRPFNEAYFRKNSGEIHRWMYDSFSLNRLMSKYGFIKVNTYLFNQSDIPGFERFELESSGGKERKPDSLYMEGQKG